MLIRPRQLTGDGIFPSLKKKGIQGSPLLLPGFLPGAGSEVGVGHGEVEQKHCSVTGKAQGVAQLGPGEEANREDPGKAPDSVS